MSWIKATLEVYKAVKPTDTTIEEIIETIKPMKLLPAVLSEVLDRMVQSKSIVEVRDGVYQRWHGVEAQKIINKEP